MSAGAFAFLGSIPAGSLAAVDKSQWPRVAPIIFVHGVGSAPGTWGVKINREIVPAGQPNWPAGDDSKTGGYFWHKSEIDSLRVCHGNGLGPGARNLDMFYKIDPATTTGPDGEEVLKRTSGIAKIHFNCACATWAGGWGNSAAFGAGTQFTTGPVTPNLTTNYDYLQSGTSRNSRRSNQAVTYTFTNGGSVGQPSSPEMAELGPRLNGVEVFDAYWTYGWPDGNVPEPLKGLRGMLYGTQLSGNNHKWVKARFSRLIDRNQAPGGDEWITYLPDDWLSVPMATRPNTTMEKYYLGPSFGPGGAYYASVQYAYATVTTTGKTTWTHTYRYVSGNTSYTLATITFASNHNQGYTGAMLPEETSYGQIGQLYIFIRKVLDKYYKDSNGSPNWYLGNGESDPDAKVVLVGHSQGGVVSRGVLYPGFGEQVGIESGYQPMYYPRGLFYQPYLAFDGSMVDMNGVWFDVRKHVAGVVSISSPHFGSPIGYALDGLYSLHKELLVMKDQNRGIYHSIWGKGFLTLDNYLVSTAGAEVQKLISDVSPVDPNPPVGGEGFNETIRAGLRRVNNYSSYKTYEPFVTPLKSLEQGRRYWQMEAPANGMAPPSSPCEPVSFLGNPANHYRLYWQPEYDNWVRSYRHNQDNNGGLANERVHTVSAQAGFAYFGKVLCEEQIGRFTRISEINNPTIASSNAQWSEYNPFSTVSISTLAKTAATSGSSGASFDQDIKDLKDCAMGVLKDATVVSGGLSGLIIPPIVNPFFMASAYEAYKGGMACIDDFKVNTNQTAQSMFHGTLANGAQGLAFHPASTFLHKLNQRGGFDQFAAERRPFPARLDGTPIPFISVVNNVASTSPWTAAGGPDANSDLTVNTLSQDLGFAYPDVSKSGSMAKFSVTGVTHTLAPTYRDTLYGPYWKPNPANSGWMLDRERNAANARQNRSSISRLIFGLAIGQSPVLANQGRAAANLNDIQNAYTIKDAEGFVLQTNSRESIQGRYTRLKGVNQDEIYEPVALPYSGDRSGYLLNRPVVVQDGQELFIPAGSTVTFGPTSALIVKSGGRLTFGGVPAFSSLSGSSITTRFVSLTTEKPNVQIRVGARLKYPDLAASLLKYRLEQVVNGARSTLIFTGSRAGSPVTLPENHLYGKYDSRAYGEYLATRTIFWTGMTVNPSIISTVNSLLND